MAGIHRMLLHAERLAFAHPADGRPLAVVAPLDGEFQRALAFLGIAWPPSGPPRPRPATAHD